MCLKYFIKSCEVHYNQNVLIYVKQHLLLKKITFGSYFNIQYPWALPS